MLIVDTYARSTIPNDSPITFKARYGANRFVVTYDALAAAQFPTHVKATTLYGRLAAKNFLINVDFELYHDDKVCVLEVTWLGGC